MTAYLGNFFVRSTDLLAFPSVTPDHSYAAEVAIDENINASVVSFQTALLHTTCYGERRIRVVTLALPVTSRMQDLYASVDQLAVASLLAKKGTGKATFREAGEAPPRKVTLIPTRLRETAVKCALTAKLEDARAALLNKVVDILGVYKTCLTASSSGATSQLTLCNNLKLLPLLVLGITKHVAFQGSSRIPIDLRSFAMSLLNILPPEALIPYIYPKLYALHRLPPNVGSPDESGRLGMPPPVNLSAEKLEQHGVYLLQTGEVSFLSVGRNTHPQLCMDLFDAPNVDALRSGKVCGCRIPSSLGRRGPARPFLSPLFNDYSNQSVSLHHLALPFLPQQTPPRPPPPQFILPVLDTDVSVATHLIMSYTRAHMRFSRTPTWSRTTATRRCARGSARCLSKTGQAKTSATTSTSPR
ncbi:MAG: LOW QUALITY PROTEIN: hypothetical protein BJ554DRAFT_597 [Olpidium bornovanus]|uniref:Uncharacterized protein n=1 Tax=Olpidium bornovanus TaxID=278681 RepID=A0A8H7ZTQ1_9FUNG|nr:MAG: LOW QUALITY PROTEIN: hypothetical protein BJ554DRAFT_597 [Olpidium bornovanus]